MEREDGSQGADEALAAAAALMAGADGAEEGSLRARLGQGRPAALAAFDGFLAHVREGRERGEDAAFQALHPVKGDASTASSLMSAALALGGGTAGLVPAQAAMARRICETLNLSPARFGL
jgi:tellurite resistance protein